MDVVYELSRSADGTSHVDVLESIVAQFPSFDQNRGIIRSIPNDYDGVPLGTTVTSVVDDAGQPVYYETEYDSGFLNLILGTDDFVHGRQSYVIEYSQNNVVRDFSDTTGSDEFYWDVNGTGWRQPFGRVTATILVHSDIVGELTGAFACYQGPLGGSAPCEGIVQLDAAPDGSAAFVASAAGLAPSETLTFAIAFAPATFVQVEPQEERAPLWSDVLGILLVILATGISVTSIVMRVRAGKDHPGRGIIVPQYSVPKLLNIMVAANLVARGAAYVPSQLVSLAVRRKIRMLGYAVTPGKAKYTLQLLDAEGVDDLESKLLVALFGSQPKPGALREIAPKDYTLGAAVRAVTSAVPKIALEKGFRLRPVNQGLGCGASALAMLLLVSSFVALGFAEPTPSGWLLLAAPLSFVTFFIAAFSAVRPAPLSETGAEHRDYLIGMKRYLELAEKERFRMLQSAEGADRIDIGDNRQVIKLYEKLLPFAVLWGIELSWLRELAVKLDPDESPDWYVGTTAFSPAVFSTTLSGLSKSATASPPSSSSGGSFSGGSSGGGSSGGGGGGGGGGGR